MEQETGLIEMVIKEIAEAIDLDKIVEDEDFDEFLTNREKIEQVFVAMDNRRLMLVEKGGTREIMTVVTPDEAGLLEVSLAGDELAKTSLAYQTIQMLRELGVTLESVVARDKVLFIPQCMLHMCKADGTPMEVKLRLVDALCVSILAKIPFYVNANFLKEQDRPDFVKEVVSNAEVVLLHMMTDRLLEREMEKAIRNENYEYAEMVKREMEARKKAAENGENKE